ncbi:MAG: 6-bladed beta-propeller [Bacteroidetes bacterium]|jgi:hypothetical protein|nr:6-bladed beta-propeller [Bacteroidota bacterium]
MKIYKKVTLAILIFFTIGFTFLFFFNEEEEKSYSDVNINTLVNIDSQREWRQVVWEKNEEFSQKSNDSLFNPVLLTSHNEVIYVGDWGGMNIKIFNKEGENTGIMGRRGRGPGEFQRIMDIDFIRDSLFISDPEKQEVIIYSKNGGYSYSLSIDHSSYRVAVSDTSIYTLAIQDSLFEIYNFEGSNNVKFGKILDNPILNQLSLSGRIEYISELDAFLYIPRFASYLFYYSADGTLEKIVETLDGIPFSESQGELAGERVQIRKPDKEVEIMDSFIGDEYLYLLGRIMKNGNPVNNDHFMDVYSIRGDEYFYSYKLPVPATQFTKIDETVYFIDLTDQSLVAFSIAK